MLTRAPIRGSDAGIFSVLYVLLVLVLIGTASFVTDISALRESRSMTRSAADSASLAAASQLNILDPGKSAPRAACQKAWKYLYAQLSGLNDLSASACSSFPSNGIACNSATIPLSSLIQSGSYKVRITWPVPYDNDLMTHPDVRPAAGLTQSENTGYDGERTDLCSRIGVEVFRNNDFGLAAALGFTRADTRAASVARGVVEGDRQDVIAALNILEPTRCDAILTSGQGNVTIQGAGASAGVIAVESSGRDNSANKCPNNRKFVIDPAANPNNFIHVLGPGGVGQGVLFSYALSGSTTGNPPDAFDLNRVTDGTISPKPTPMFETFGANPVTDIFDCKPAAPRNCTKPAAPWITNLVSSFSGSGAPTSGYAGAGPGYRGGSFTTLPGPSVPSFACTTGTGDPPVVVPPGNWYVNCDTLSVGNTMIFQGGVIVTKGGIEAGNNTSCFVVNVATTTCPVINPTAIPPNTVPPATGDAILFMRGGRLYKISQAQMYLAQTFTYLADANNPGPSQNKVDLGGGSGSLLWTNPVGSDCTSLTPPADQTCRDQRFVRLTLWSESVNPHSIGGQTGLRLRGVLFTPNAEFTYDGQGTQNQTDAQFWTKLLVVKGQAGLTMVADPNASVSRPTLGVSLIR
jgi:hypothetical protein